MSEFVNYNKRGIKLPKGCKDLADVLKLGNSNAQSGAHDIFANAKCDYCGAPAVGGSSTYSDGRSTRNFWCGQCLNDLMDFHRRPENSIPDDADFNDEKVKRLIDEISRREQEFMRHRGR